MLWPLSPTAALSALAIAVGAVLWLTSISEPSGAEAPESPAIATPAADPRPALDPAQCQSLIERAAKDGIVRAMPDGNRIDVEDRLWAMLPARDKKALASAVACRAFDGRALDQLNAGQYAVVYGYRSGKRVAMAASFGVTVE